LAVAGEFEGNWDPVFTDKYRCDGEFSYVTDSPGNQALKLVHPTTARKCEHLRVEVAEANSQRVLLRTEVWYSFRFKVPAEMRGRIQDRRLVNAQLKQHKQSCPLAGTSTTLALADGNPIISVRLSEDATSGIVGISLNASSNYVGKIPFGMLMRLPSDFYDRWHAPILHTKVVPRLESDPIGQ
jgi:hypothetical protein